ncbi:Abortive infection bacteriophage resistance protein [Campylobacter ureolyticus]|uniref:Abi family protein n=1 Tax=Campylobacter ureolyticus TaxID=827 RepID=UPI000DF107B3|nr:Abi family protein [Campylobacter ureolyticus]STA63175.1 Abortive infection bacteriophage resistance protein [Campylobacter ureolyticus]
MSKLKLNIDEQITNMKSKGIKFNIITENEAKHLLEYSSYYFKIKSYCRNYQKINDKYINLEFAYLYELSKIDMYLRIIIIDISLNIEHTLKTAILRDFNMLPNNGEDIVNGFLNSRYGQSTRDYINRQRGDESVSNRLITNNTPPNMPFWILVEVIQFGDLRKLYKYFYQRFTRFKSVRDRRELDKMIFSTKSLRNLAAHNNCIITNIFDNSARLPICKNELTPFKIQIEKNLNDSIDETLKNRYIGDFLMMMWLAMRIIKSDGLKNHIKMEISEFFKKTCMSKKRKRYFFKNRRFRDRVCLIYRSYKTLSNI